ncbi:MAG: YceI family protein [Elusimicrobiales bacterium]|nr:YceI family protein [Elusimicrobiales bacterium]
MKAAFKTVLLAAAAGLFSAGGAFSADKYVIDTAHSNIGFSVKHLGISKVKGKFGVFSGFIMADEKNLANCSVEVEIKADSISTDNEKRDAHLKTADFFDVEKFPTLTFKSKQVKKTKGGYTATGTFTMHGVSKEISIPFTMEKAMDPWKKMRIGVEGGLSLNRKDYGINWSNLMDNGGLVVSNDVKIDLSVEAVKE